MNHAIHPLGWNALLAVPLAMAIWLICRTRALRQRPALCHGLWLLVLLKLATPQFILVPIPWTTTQRGNEIANTTIAAENIGDETVGSLSFGGEIASDKAGFQSNSKQNPTLEKERLLPGAHELPVQADTFVWRHTGMALFPICTLVSAIILACAVRQFLRIRQILSLSGIECGRVAKLLQEVSGRFGLRTAPELVIVDASITPMLWGIPGKPVIILPRDLADSFDDDQLRCVIAHELAHFVRHDHWTHLFASVVTALFWWHPVAWFARRQMAAAAETCCDALALTRLAGSRKSYAKTLLAIIDFVGQSRPARPSMGIPFCSSGAVRRRFQQIADSSVKSNLSHAGWLLLGIGFAGLLLAPTAAQQSAPPVDSGPRPVKGNEPALQQISQDDAPKPDDANVVTDQYGDPVPAGARARMGSIRFRHPSYVLAVAFAPDGTKVASASGLGDVRLWDATTGRLLHVLQTNERRAINAIGFSPDGKILAAAGESDILFWNADNGSLVRKIHVIGGEKSEIYSVAFSPDGSTLATGLAAGTVRIWVVRTGTIDREFLQTDHRRFNHAVSFSPDGKLLASGHGRSITIRNLDAGGKPVIIEQAHSHEIVSLAFHPDGKRVISGGVRGESKKSAAGKNYFIDHGEVKVWDAQSGEQLAGLEASGTEPGACIALSADGRVLVTASTKEVLVWDFAAEQLLRKFGGFENRYGLRAHTVALSPDGKRVALTTGWGTDVRVWDVDSGESISDRFESHSMRVAEATFLAAGAVIATTSADNTLRTWDAATGKQLSKFEVRSNLHRRCCFSRDGRLLLWTFATSQPETFETIGMARVVEVSTGKIVREMMLPHDVTSATISAAGDLAAIATSNVFPWIPVPGNEKQEPTFQIHVWNVRSGEKVATLLDHTGNVFALQFARDGQSLLSAAEDNSIRTWDLEHDNERAMVILAIEGRHPYGLFSPDGTSLITSTRNAIQIWNVSQGTERLRLLVPNTLHSRLCVSRDGSVLATAGGQVFSTTDEFDESIHLWDLKTGRELLKLGTADAAVSTLAFSDDGRTLVTGTEMGTTLVWDVSAAYKSD